MTPTSSINIDQFWANICCALRKTVDKTFASQNSFDNFIVSEPDYRSH